MTSRDSSAGQNFSEVYAEQLAKIDDRCENPLGWLDNAQAQVYRRTDTYAGDRQKNEEILRLVLQRMSRLEERLALTENTLQRVMQFALKTDEAPSGACQPTAVANRNWRQGGEDVSRMVGQVAGVSGADKPACDHNWSSEQTTLMLVDRNTGRVRCSACDQPMFISAESQRLG